MMVFPACAGVILRENIVEYFRQSVPRMCGGDPKAKNPFVNGETCSPHVRG